MIRVRSFEDAELVQAYLQGGGWGNPIVLARDFTHLDTLTLDFTAPLAMTVTFAAGGGTLRAPDIASQIATQTLAAGAQVNAFFHKDKLILVEDVPVAGVTLSAYVAGVTSTAGPELGLATGFAGVYYNSDFTTSPYFLSLTSNNCGLLQLLTEE